MRALFSNLFAGVRLAIAAPVELRHFCCSADQLVSLAVLALAVSVGHSAWTYGSLQLLTYSLVQQTFQLLLLLFLGYVLAKIARRHEVVCDLPVMLLSLTPVACLIAAGLAWSARGEVPTDARTWWAVTMGIYAFWSAAVCVRALALASGVRWPRLVPLSVLYVLLCWLPMLASVSLWRATNETSTAAADDSWKRWADGEATMYAQAELLDRRLGELLPERAGVADLYFVGFAGDGRQDVFMNEVLYVRDLMDDRFDTRGRSVALINNRRTSADVPLASATSLRRTLSRLETILNPEEDILFLFLTSHGSADHELTVRHWPFPLNDLPAAELAELVERSSVRWKVIVVSACYSGGFLDRLKDEGTLVMTAAARDRQSFGCSDEATMTDFGRAFFQNGLSHRLSFVSAFEAAAKLIEEREAAESRRPSMPQIHAPAPIREKLRGLQERLGDGLRMARG
jgi:hypothetical protein